jgi:hypothetical protein
MITTLIKKWRPETTLQTGRILKSHMSKKTKIVGNYEKISEHSDFAVICDGEFKFVFTRT